MESAYYTAPADWTGRRKREFDSKHPEREREREREREEREREVQEGHKMTSIHKGRMGSTLPALFVTEFFTRVSV